MSRSIDLVRNSLEFYDKNNQLFDKHFARFKSISYKSNDKDTEHPLIIFYDKDNNKIFESRYEIIGLYNNYGSVWSWAWALPSLDKNVTNISRKILFYGLDIVPSNEDKFLKTELITSRFRISDLIQLDIHVGIASYLSKMPAVFHIVISPERAQETLKLKDIELMGDTAQVYYYFLLDAHKLLDKVNESSS